MRMKVEAFLGESQGSITGVSNAVVVRYVDVLRVE